MAEYTINRIRESVGQVGWDVSILMVDGDKKESITFRWPKKEKPTEKSLADKIAYLLDRFVNRREPQAEGQTFLKSEVEDILKEKGYLQESDTLEDLKVVK
ncbi:MAG: hypothetical protein GY869_20995 [Planctomycetes bacterium]|nr:hypothetical protein [Planctomycetota bacterium]